DGEIILAHLNRCALSARQAADRLIVPRDVERTPAEIEDRFGIDQAGDANRAREDVGDAIEIIVAAEGQDAGSHLVEDTAARKGAEEIIIVRAVENETPVVDDIARELAFGSARAELEAAVPRR